MGKRLRAVRDTEQRLERAARNVLTKEALGHIARAGKEAVAAANASLDGFLIPPRTRQHLLQAQRELLMAVRSFVDSALQEMGEKPPKARARPGLKKIRVKRR